MAGAFAARVLRKESSWGCAMRNGPMPTTARHSARDREFGSAAHPRQAPPRHCCSVRISVEPPPLRAEAAEQVGRLDEQVFLGELLSRGRGALPQFPGLEVGDGFDVWQAEPRAFRGKCDLVIQKRGFIAVVKGPEEHNRDALREEVRRRVALILPV